MGLVSKEALAEQQGDKLGLPYNVPLPKDRYSARIKSCDFGQSKSSGQNMLTVVGELYMPETVKAIDGKQYSIAGSEFTAYYSLQPQALYRLFELMDGCQLKAEIDPENPETKQFVGKCFSGVFGADKREQRKDPTPEQLAAGIKQGDPILKEDGSPDIGYAIRLVGSVTPTKHAPKTPLNPY